MDHGTRGTKKLEGKELLEKLVRNSNIWERTYEKKKGGRRKNSQKSIDQEQREDISLKGTVFLKEMLENKLRKCRRLIDRNQSSSHGGLSNCRGGAQKSLYKVCVTTSTFSGGLL